MKEAFGGNPLRLAGEQDRALPFDVRLARAGFRGRPHPLRDLHARQGSLGSSFPDSGFTGGWHGTSHHGDKPENVARYAKVNRYHVQNLAYFAAKLDKIPEGDGTVLDHILIYKGSNMELAPPRPRKGSRDPAGRTRRQVPGQSPLCVSGQHGADLEHAARRIAQVRYRPHSPTTRPAGERDGSPVAQAQTHRRWEGERMESATTSSTPLLAGQALLHGAVSEVANADAGR